MYRYRPTFLLILLILLVVAGLTGLTWANYRFAAQNPGGNDFLARWMGAQKWLLEGLSPYDPQVSLATQEMIYGRPADPAKDEDVGHFVYPLPSMVFFAPFGLFDYPLARALWMTTLELALAALTLISLRLVQWRPSPWQMALMFLFSVLWYHGARTIIVGQFAAVEALLIAAALLFILREQDGLAGFFLALGIAKPQMLYLILPFILLWAYSQRRFRLIWGFLVSSLVIFIISLAFIPNWPVQMIWQMLDYPEYSDRIGSLISIITSPLPGIQRQLETALWGFFSVYLLVEWILAWKKGPRWFLWTASMTLVLTNFLTARAATTNYVMMIPALILIFRVWVERWGKKGQAVVWGVMAVALVGLWILFIQTVQGNLEQPAMYVPLPLFCLLGLWWVRWWFVRSAFLPAEEL
ncbi:MAG: DUF2029 domain-containing protein [Anaerolineae bacterium]|nr:DUF2029 domain-containing protein [Anaerolineae bacterium]